MKQKYAIRAVTVVTVVLMAALCCLIRPAADDFYYVTFCDEGLADYITNTIYHYQNITGRVFVHLVLCPLLQWNMWPFRIFNLLMICFLAGLSAKVCSDSHSFSLPGFAAFLCLFWLIGIETLADSVLWGAGSLNYLFPVTLVILYYYLFQKYLLRETGGAWVFIAAFLCAETVEMTGILTVLAIPYLCLVNRNACSRRKPYIITNFISAVLGYAFLFTSSGVSARLETNEFASVSLLDRINANFALFDRKMCGPEGIWVIVLLALLSAALLLFRRGKKISCGITLLSAGLIVLTGLGIIYDGIALAAVAVPVFLVLCVYAVWTYSIGDRVIPFCMLCTTVSLAICMVSPVVGARLVLPSAVFLSIICIRSVQACGLPQKGTTMIVCGLAVPAVILLSVYVVKFAENAKVIDNNTLLAENCPSDGVLRLSYVPDEIYGGTTVPSPMNFGGSFLMYQGIPDAVIECSDPTAVPVSHQGQVHTNPAVLRGGQYYVPVRTAAEATGAEVTWELASAVVTTENAQYCFHKDNRAVNLGHGVCRAYKLNDPVRMIDGRIYISVRDFEMIFQEELTLPEP